MKYLIPCLRWLLRALFGFQAFNTEVLKTPGPVLLIPNHVSWLDWLFVGTLLEEDWKFVVSRQVSRSSWLHRVIMENRRTFPIDPNSPYAVKHMAEYLEGGGRMVLFAEGQITYTGCLMKLYDGTGFLLFKSKAKVITCFLRGANRLRWSRQPGWRKWFPKVTAHFNLPSNYPDLSNQSTTQARATLTNWLRDRMIQQQFEAELERAPSTVLAAILEAAVERPKSVILEDFSGQCLTYRKLIVGTHVLARCWNQRLPANARRIGVLLPNVNATPATLTSLWAAGKIPCLLNFTSGAQSMIACSQLASIQHVITSRAFLEKAAIDPAPFEKANIQLHFLEDVRAGVGGWQKAGSLIQMSLDPQSLVRGQKNRASAPASDQDAAVVLFTSGSEGVPKGVELTHRNLLANIWQVLSIIDLQDQDRLFNALPLFHSFGLTVGALLPLVRGVYTFLYPSPLHYKLLPSALYTKRCTVFFSTSTFLNGYARKAHPYDFRTVRLLIAGAEKLQESISTTYARKFGVRVLEGYGATECSPVVSANTPIEPKFGSVGKLLPGMECRMEPVDGVEEGGRLFVKGPNVMKGYLNEEANRKFQAMDGWYDTGDIARMDKDGFLYIQGRLKRFAKVSGEMISLAAVEDALAGAFPEFGLRCQIAVLSQPDEDKGEVLVAVTNEKKVTQKAVREVIRSKGFPNLCVPKSVIHVKEIPKLGTGKVNHRALAAEVFSD